MTRAGKTCWKAVRVLVAVDAAKLSRELLGAERLAALYRFQTGAPSFGHRFVDGHRADDLGDPDQIDWATFPVVAALEAVACDELRRLRMLLSDGALELSAHPPPSSSPHGWGIDASRGATAVTTGGAPVPSSDV